MLKKSLPLLLVVLAAIFGVEQFTAHDSSDTGSSASPQTASENDTGRDAITAAYRNHAQDLPVSGKGEVVKVLRDDTRGDQHQRFILRVARGQTVLVAHNIDLAPRIANLHAGDTVGFNGIYEWNPQGGVVHWTHRDPGGRHAAGWLERNGQRYQ